METESPYQVHRSPRLVLYWV